MEFTEVVYPAIAVLTFASATTAILSSYFVRKPIVFYITKPLTTTLILVPVLTLMPDSGGAYIPLIAGGLAFALLGDILLMLPEERFVLGIASFAATHVLYLAAFIVAAGIALINPSAIALIIFATLMARFLWSGVRKSLQIPILAYVVLITVMTAQAIGAALASESTGLAIAAAGAVLFLASDSILAVDRFRMPFPAARALVLSTYWLGQWLIALSTRVGA
ncbi:MAG: lysoplasmalogenase [Anaerolineales bacterium]